MFKFTFMRQWHWSRVYVRHCLLGLLCFFFDEQLVNMFQNNEIFDPHFYFLTDVNYRNSSIFAKVTLIHVCKISENNDNII